MGRREERGRREGGVAGGEQGGREEAAVAVFGASSAEQGHINPTTRWI